MISLRLSLTKHQWDDGSLTDFTWWDEGYPPVNHRDCLAAFPGLGWRDVHCSGQGGLVVVCQIGGREGRGRTTQISYYNSSSRSHHKYIPVIIIIITAFALTLVISVILTLKFINKISLICFRVFYQEFTGEYK